MNEMMMVSESILTRFGFDLMTSKSFKSGFFIVGKASYVNIAITYGYKNGFSVDILPNKEFIGLTVDISPFDFPNDPTWEVELLNIVRRALKQNAAIERKFLMNEKFREITNIKLNRMQRSNIVG